MLKSCTVRRSWTKVQKWPNWPAPDPIFGNPFPWPRGPPSRGRHGTSFIHVSSFWGIPRPKLTPKATDSALFWPPRLKKKSVRSRKFQFLPGGAKNGPEQILFSTLGGCLASWLFRAQLNIFWRFLPVLKGADQPKVVVLILAWSWSPRLEKYSKRRVWDKFEPRPELGPLKGFF